MTDEKLERLMQLENEIAMLQAELETLIREYEALQEEIGEEEENGSVGAGE